MAECYWKMMDTIKISGDLTPKQISDAVFALERNLFTAQAQVEQIEREIRQIRNNCKHEFKKLNYDEIICQWCQLVQHRH